MIKKELFKEWLSTSTTYTNNVVNDIVCRLNRANKMLEISTFTSCEFYLFALSQKTEFMVLNGSVKAQIKKSVKLYYNFLQK